MYRRRERLLMFFRYAPRYVHIGCAVMTVSLPIVTYLALNNPFLLFGIFPGIVFWIAAAQYLGRRRLIRLATGNAWRWRSIVICGSIDVKSATHTRKAVRKAGRRKHPLAVFIDSGGGDLVAMREIITALRSHGERVVAIAVGQCMSAAAITLCSLPPGDRFATPECSIMIHSAHSVTREKKVKKRRAKQLKESQLWLNALVNSTPEGEETPTVNDFLAERVSEGTDLSLAFLRELFASGGDLYFTAATAHRVGFIGEILNP